MNPVSSRSLSTSGSDAADRLQRSLDRIAQDAAQNLPDTSVPADKSSNFSAAAQRLSDSFDLQSETARLQQQDSVLQQTAALLSRVDELKSLQSDPTTSDAQRAVFEEEFAQLQSNLSALSGHSIDGEPLFTAGSDEPEATDESAAAETAENSTANAPDYTTSFTDDFSTADNWESVYGSLSVNDHTLYPTSGYYGSVQTKQSFRGAMEIQFDLFLPGAGDSVDVAVGNTHLSNLTDSANLNKWQWHSVRIAYDGAGTASTYLDGSAEAADTQVGLEPGDGQLSLANLGLGSAWIKNFSVTATGEAVASLAPRDPSSADLAAVADTTTLADLDQQTIDNANAHLAELQSANDEALVSLSDESPTVNPIENSDASIADADYAAELNSLTTQEILQNSSDVFLAQANLDEESVLTLLG